MNLELEALKSISVSFPGLPTVYEESNSGLKRGVPQEDWCRQHSHRGSGRRWYRVGSHI